jgi:lipopolysaccharide export system permease protein
VKIISRYVLKEHVGPFVFALSALTSLLLLQYIARRFGDLVGKGLPWQVIAEFFALALPFTVAMTLPMAVLVAVLYAYSRLAAENEITAIKAGGISSRRLMVPSLLAAIMLAVGMLVFNDQVLPRSNHRLAGLQLDILRTKPTFALREQVINAIREGQTYLRAGHIDEATSHLRDVDIYDTYNQNQRRTIYAETAVLTLAPNQRDLTMRLYNGMMLTAPVDKPGQLTRIYYREDLLKVRDVAGSLKRSDADTVSKGEREMSICEMQREFSRAVIDLRRAQADHERLSWKMKPVGPEPLPVVSYQPAGGIGGRYCSLVTVLTNRFRVKQAVAAEVPQDTGKKRPVASPSSVPPQLPNSVFVLVDGAYVKVARDKIPANATFPGGGSASPAGSNQPPATPQPPPATLGSPGAAGSSATTTTPATTTPPASPPAAAGAAAAATTYTPQPPDLIGGASDLAEAKIRLTEAKRRSNRYGVEIEKKFSLAAACIVFVLVGAPIALRFPHGGIGLVIGVSFIVFATYYVALIGGEELANRGIISSFWAMWGANVIFLAAGMALIVRMGHETNTARGGGQLMERVRAIFTRTKAAA